MGFDTHPNLAIGTVLTAPSPASSGTSLVLNSGQGARFTATVGYNATVWPGNVLPDPTNAEIVRITAVSTDTLTITRTQEGTSARSILVGDVIVVAITAKVLTDIEAVIASPLGAAGTHLESSGSVAQWIAEPSWGITGDGSDGVVNFDGSTTVLGLAPVSSVYTLTRDIYLADGSQLSNSSTQIKTAGFRIFCDGVLTLAAGTIISNDGTSSGSNTAGTGGGTGTTGYAGAAAGAGVVGVGSGTGGTSQSNACGGSGGAGGGTTGSGGTGGGAAGGTATAPTAGFGGIPRNVWNFLYAAEVHVFSTLFNGGCGGGGGNSVASSTSGGGGGAGAGVFVSAVRLVNNGTIRANGGAGSNASGSGTGSGGGGGGGGGIVCVVCGPGSTTGTLQANGGTGGTNQGAGNKGVNGSNGTVLTLNL